MTPVGGFGGGASVTTGVEIVGVVTVGAVVVGAVAVTGVVTVGSGTVGSVTVGSGRPLSASTWAQANPARPAASREMAVVRLGRMSTPHQVFHLDELR